jgi:hypothetical protein
MWDIRGQTVAFRVLALEGGGSGPFSPDETKYEKRSLILIILKVK